MTVNGTVAGVYDKIERVPFGEYIPLAERFPKWAEEMREKTPLWPDIAQGKNPRLLVDKDLRIGPLICSEDIDMRYVHRIARQKPNLLVSIISDAWFGDSGGPEQHLALATFRAIETRRDLVRATNTGVSALVDGLGRVRLQGPLYEVKENSQQPPTLLNGQGRLVDIAGFAPYTERFFPLACLLGLVAALLTAGKDDSL